MHEEITIKEELISPAECFNELMFDRFDVEEGDNRKLSCSSNDSSLSSIASSTDSGYSAYSNVVEKKNFLIGGNQVADSAVVQKNLELHLSSVQRDNIQAILDSVGKLSDTEKLLLYLKLPTRDQEQPITLSNTKQEQTQAFQWIRNNLEQCDNSVNLPKHEVYDQYRAHCESQGSKRYLSAPDFGKIVKCMFPNVKARRLGTRGNSKYCYNGLQKKLLTESPKLPDITTTQTTTNQVCENVSSPLEETDSTDQTFAAACVVVCEWANKLLGRFFTTLVELAKFLVGGSYVSTKSMAAFTVMSATQEKIELFNKRFSLEALVKSATTRGSDKISKTKVGKPVNTSAKITPSENSISSPTQSIQVVPHTPTKDLRTISAKADQVKFERFQIDTTAPVFLDDNNDRHTHDILLEDVNLIIQDLDKSTKAAEIISQQTHITNRTQSTPKKDKRKPEPLQTQKLNPDKSSQITHIYPNKPPASAPPIGVKTPKKVGRPRTKKANSSPYPIQSPRQGNPPNVMSPRYIQNMPPPNTMRPNLMQNKIGNFPMPSPSPSVDNELHNIFLNSRMAIMHQVPPDLQRCQSVPVPQNIPHDLYQPLTPQVHISNANIISPRGNTYKAKRDLTSFFAEPDMKNNLNFDMFQNKQNRLGNNVINQHMDQRTDRLVPTSFQHDQPNNNIPSYYNSNNFQTKDLGNFQELNDMGGMFPEFANTELLNIHPNLQHVDGDELLKSLQNTENIWANEWSNSTLPLMNIKEGF